MKSIKRLAIFGIVTLAVLALMLVLANQFDSVYKVLAIVPIQRDVSLSQLGDSYLDKKKYVTAAGYYQRAELYSSQPHKCVIYIKAGDSNNNAATNQDQPDQQIQYLQAASDQYARCLIVEPDNNTAKSHQQTVEAQLQKLLQQQSEQTQSDSQPSQTPSLDSTEAPVIHW